MPAYIAPYDCGNSDGFPCETPAGFDLDAYIASGELDFTVGDTIDLKARIAATVATHLQERLLHSNQTITACNDGCMLLNVTVQDTNELRWWLLVLAIK